MHGTTKKLFSVILCLVLLFAAGLTANAATLSGDGTIDNPYIIGTASELDTFSALVKEGNTFDGAYVSLADNITVSAQFMPIGTEANPFRGSFNGNGFTLSGFDADCDYAALFAFTDGAVITDVNVSGTFFATDYAAGIVAFAEDTIISSCISSATVYSDNYTGGIVAFIDGGSVTDCSTSDSAIVVGYEENCGGIAGYSKADIKNCSNNAYIRGNKNVGGIAGVSEKSITSSVNLVAVSASEGNFGGIAGFAKGTIAYCENKGRVSANASSVGKAGGIAGVCIDAKISECSQSGAVSATGEYTGGIAGYLTGGSISDCISTGTVSTASDFAGGIFGSTSKTDVTRCIFTESVTSASGKSAAIGAISGGSVSDCYYDSAKNTKAFVSAVSDKGAKAISSSDFVLSETFTGFNFDTVWEINDIHASYPLLKSVPFHTLTLVSETPASCTANGIKVSLCTICNERIEEETEKTGHSIVTVSEKQPSCSVAGYIDTVCENCDYTDTKELPALGHKDADSDKKCDLCKASVANDTDSSDKGIFEKIADFFRQIIDWFRSLFN